MAETQQSVSEWADMTFGPASSNARIAARANEEMAELLRALTADDNNPRAPEEIVDVMIVLFRLATRMGFDIWNGVDHKMAINRARKWNVTTDGHGYHVRERAQ